MTFQAGRTILNAGLSRRQFCCAYSRFFQRPNRTNRQAMNKRPRKPGNNVVPLPTKPRCGVNSGARVCRRSGGAHGGCLRRRPRRSAYQGSHAAGRGISGHRGCFGTRRADRAGREPGHPRLAAPSARALSAAKTGRPLRHNPKRFVKRSPRPRAARGFG